MREEAVQQPAEVHFVASGTQNLLRPSMQHLVVSSTAQHPHLICTP
jgi:hypothetical protein